MLMYTRGISILLMLTIAVNAARLLTSYTVRTRDPAWTAIPEDIESKLAAGGTLKLSTADIFEIELIPGITAKFSEEIFTQKNGLLSEADASAPVSALSHLKGIGKTRAAHFARCLSFE